MQKRSKAAIAAITLLAGLTFTGAPPASAGEIQFVRFTNWGTGDCLIDTGSDIISRACGSYSSDLWNKQTWIIQDSPNGGGRLNLRNWASGKCLYVEGYGGNGVKSARCNGSRAMDWVADNNRIESVSNGYAKLYDEAGTLDIRISGSPSPAVNGYWDNAVSNPR